jgi:hypothetical protein
MAQESFNKGLKLKILIKSFEKDSKTIVIPCHEHDEDGSLSLFMYII